MTRKFYITTPIYYVNARPHIGHAYTTHRLRHDCAAAAPAGRRHVLPDRHRRARAEDRARGAGCRQDSAAVCRRDFGGVPQPVEADGNLERRLHPHHRRAAQEARAGTVPAHSRQRLHLQGHVHRAVLRFGRTLRRWRAARRSLPDLRAHHRDRARRKLLLQALGVSGQAAGALCESGVHSSRDAAQ